MGEGKAAALFADLGLAVDIHVGRARPTLAELSGLGPGSVLPLDRGLDEPVELFVGDRRIASGTLEEAEDGQLQVRITAVGGAADG